MLKLQVQSIAFSLALMLCLNLSNTVYAQSVMKVNGNPCVGSTLTYVLAGPSCSSVSWSSNGTIISQSNSSVDVRWNSPTANAWVQASYSSCSFGSSGTSTSSAIAISGPVTPSVSVSANQNNVCSSTTITFTAAPVNGGSNPNYTWQVNGTTVSSGTANTYSRANFSNGDVVRVLMASAHPCATSSSVTSNNITISITPPVTPSVSISSSSMPFCQGIGTFSAGPTNAGSSPTYTWLKNGSPVNDNVSGTPMYTYQPQFSLVNGDRIKYRMTTSLSCASPTTVESNEIVVSTTSQITPTIGISPAVTSFCQGTNVTFTASGGAGYTLSNYEWKLNGSAVGTVNSPTYSTTQFTQGSVLTVSATASGSCLSSSNASGTTGLIPFTVTPMVTPGVSIVVSPSSTICAGATATFTATPVNGGTPSYDWQINGVTVSSGSSNTFSRSNLNTDDVVRVIMSSTVPCKTANTATSNSITVTVNPVTTASVSIGSGGMPICSGTSTSFAANPVNGGISPTYVWYKNDFPVTDNSNTVPPYVYAPQSPLAAGDRIKVRMTSNLSCATPSTSESNVVTVSFVSTGTPGMSIGPSRVSICQGDDITFSAAGSAGYTISNYQWKLNGSNVGTNSSTYSTNLFTQGSQVTVTATATDVCFNATNVSATTELIPITVTPKPSAMLDFTGDRKICEACSFAVSTASAANYTYQWLKNSSPIPNATSASYSVNSAGSYTVRVINGPCTVVSPAALNVIVNIRPTANAGQDMVLELPQGQTVLHGSGTDPDGSITGYTWLQVSGPPIGNVVRTQADLSLSGLIAGTYVFDFSVTDDTGDTSPADRVSVTVNYPTNNYNWIKETIVKVPDKKTISQVTSLPANERNIVWNYFDGFGAPLQSVTVAGSPLGKDIVKPFAYDAFGREALIYLPYVSAESSGWLKPDALRDPTTTQTDALLRYRSGQQYAFYQLGGLIAADQFPYAETKFEASPLNRAKEQGAPGVAWQRDGVDSYTSQDRTLKNAYEINTEADNVLLWTYTLPTSSYPLGLVDAGTASAPIYYPPNTLFKNRKKDEQGHEVIEYEDKNGRIVLKRVQAVDGVPAMNDTNYASTYYIYDDFGNLVCVLQPEGVKVLATQYYHSGASDSTKNLFLKRWSFRYTYDQRRRMTQKQVPGAEPVYMVYDKRDRLVLTQDGNQRSGDTKYWLFTKYDVFDRPIMTGKKDTTALLTPSQMQSAIDDFYNKSWTKLGESFKGNAAGNIHGYTNESYPVATRGAATNEADYLTVTYYDHYLFTPLATSAFNPGEVGYKSNELAGQYNYGIAGKPFAGVRGLVTGTKTLIVEGTQHLWTINYYDDRFRVVQSLAANHKQGADRYTYVYNFAGELLKTKLTHRVGSTTRTIERSFDYDHAGRLLKTWHQVNNKTKIILSANEYNELGQLIQKKLHASSDATVDDGATTYGAADLQVTSYNNENAFIGRNSVVLKPGVIIPAGKTVVIRTENAWTPSNSDPADDVYAQVIDYRYNIRGWLEKINDVDAPGEDLFTMDLRYNSPTALGGAAQYNGNISEIRWSSAGLDKQSYAYAYDPMNRLTEAKYYNAFNPINNNRFNESIKNGAYSGYDLNGNILKLQRSGMKSPGVFDLIDDLTYTYTKGNQLTKVDDAKPMFATEAGFKELKKENDEYDYDANGNMTLDKNKGISNIRYNHLNLPLRVRKSASDSLIYTYDATGRKLRQEVFGSTAKITDYIGDFIYENHDLQFINHEEGRIVMTSANPSYEYFLRDHLGNVRVTFKGNSTTEEFKATLENNTIATETSTFRNYPASGSRSALNLFDHTDAGTAATYSQLLTGAPNYQVGLAKSFEVMPGDVFDLEVWAKYEAPTANNANLTALLPSLISVFSLPVTGGTGTESAAARSTFTSLYDNSIYLGDEQSINNAAPRAYLNYILFDQNYALVDFGFDQIESSADQNSTHDQLSLHVNVQQKGYLYIFISNENPVLQNVYFDDMKIVRHTLVEQVQDYYPFGLTFNSYGRENSVVNQYKFNGKEEQDELGLGWLDYGARMYMSDIGRWGVIDPLSDKMRRWSPYNYTFNNPIRFIDPDGMAPGPSPLRGIIDGVKKLYNFFTGDASTRSKVNVAAKILLPTDAINVASKTIQNQTGLGSHEISKQEYVEAAKDVVSNASSLFAGPETRAAKVADVAFDVAVVASPKQLAKKAAGELREAGGKLPTMTGAAVDKTTGRSAVEVSGNPQAQLVSPLKEQAPNPSLEAWSPCNCAETKAVNKLVQEGSLMGDIIYHTVRTRSGSSAAPCNNCQQTLKGAQWVDE